VLVDDELVSHQHPLSLLDANESNHSTLNEGGQMDLVLSGSEIVIDLVPSGRRMNVLDPCGNNSNLNGNNK
ncbi:hypothetical protein HAX54_025249, partial [Datura stramonium]|nr:hypothetical protein [Datura stramonium]